jgi:hypothetical protein
MKRVTGIGGIFFKAKDPVALRAWYQKHLGIDVQPWGGTAFFWADDAGNPMKGTTIWNIGEADNDYYAPSQASFMINYRVTDGDVVGDECSRQRRCARKAARCSTRPTIPSTGSSAG